MTTKKKNTEPDDILPDEAEIASALQDVRAFGERRDCSRVRGFLDDLAQRPPQVVLLEGGDAHLRLKAALYWSLLVNCQANDSQGLLPGAVSGVSSGPCYTCAACRAMALHMHRDMFFLDGQAGSIKIDDVRAVLPTLGEPPREAKRRIVLLAEAQALVEAAANTLLKSMEEPREATTFILLAPQRERLLPTLVSRSFVLTLPWILTEGAPQEDDEATVVWEAALCSFLATGERWFDLTGSRGAVDAGVAQTVCSLCRKALARRLKNMSGREKPRQGLDEFLARLPAARLRIFDEALAECQESLQNSVNPGLVMDWLATRLYLLIPR